MAMATLGMGLSLKMPTRIGSISIGQGTRSRSISISIGQGSSSFLKGLTHWKPTPVTSPNSRSARSPSYLPVPVTARKVLEGKVVCATNDKTVRVEVTRMVVHPKYKRRIRVKRNFQAHDPDNKFKVGEMVILQSCKPISKTKAFLAIPRPPRKDTSRSAEQQRPEELSLSLESATP